MGRRWLTALVAFALIFVGLPFGARPASAEVTHLVISQVYGGGGNADALFKNDFIELFNPTGSSIDLTGWSVQYGSPQGTTWLITDLSGAIASGRYYLIQEAAGGGGTVDLPVPDATSTINMGAIAGKVALVNNSTLLSGACPSGGEIVDLVGYGGQTNCSETAPAFALGNTIAALRKSGGSVDTDNNNADFENAAPNPRSGTDLAPSVTATTPAAGATGVAVDTSISITFSEPVTLGADWYAITCESTGSHTSVVAGGPTTFTLDPTVDFTDSEACTVTVVAAQVMDQDTNDPPDAMSADVTFSFETAELISVVVSQVYGGGGNAGATLKNDFIELYNRGTASVSLAGWSVQYASAAGTSWATTVLSGSIVPGAYYLIQEAQGAGGTVNLPTPDATGAIAMSATAGKVALVNSTLALTGACPSSTAFADLVGYGTTATCFEGSGPAPTLTNTTADLRADDGATDTNNNASDFAAGAPNPRNSVGPADEAPRVSSTSPGTGALGVDVAASISVTFFEPVNVSGSWYAISCATSGAHTGPVSGGPLTFTVDPAGDFSAGEICAVTISRLAVADQDTNDPPDNMAADYSWSFTTAAGPPVTIHDIQGASHFSPLNNQTVTGVAGIVTARRTNGFYFQDPNADANDATSEGIFVFTSSAPTVSVGDSVKVSGKVTEFRPGGATTGNLTTTEIGGPTVALVSSGNPLPATTRIGIDRTPPTTVLEDDATGDVETTGIFDPENDGIDFWESLEGMRVEVDDPVITGPSNSFNEISVLANNGAGATGRSARGGVILSATDSNPEKIIVDDEILTLLGFAFPTQISVGDHFVGPVIGVLDYNFGNFMIEATQALTKSSGGLAREVTATPGAHQLAIATFNLENLDPGDGAAKFAQLAALIVNNLRSPDLIAGEEVQDNNGPTNDGTVTSTVTLDTLVAAIEAAGGPHYEYRLIDPVDDLDGGEPGGNIRQVFLFRTDRGLAFVDRAGGGSTTATTVSNVGGSPQLSSSPGRVAPTSTAFDNSRKPLAGEFTYNGQHLIVIANHFNSKGGDQPLWGHFQPPVRSSETQRWQQATIVRDFVRSILAIDATANVVVMGDINDFEFSTTAGILKETPLLDLIETLPANERYTYVFEGNSQTLDHILVSTSLGRVATTDIVHVNSEFWDQASDHEPQVAMLTLADTTPPTVTAPADVMRGTGPGATSCATFISDADLGTASAVDNTGSVTITRGGVPAGNLFPVGTTTITHLATDGAGNTASATQLVTVNDNTPPAFTVVPPDASYQAAGDVPPASAGAATATDNCGTPTVTVSESSNGGAGSGASPLILTRTFIATDSSGNTATAIQTITVVDTTAPVITAPTNVTLATGPGATSCGAFVSDAELGTASATDNLDGVTITRSGVPAGNLFPVGTTVVTYTATDAAGNTASATQVVTVIDNTPPTITAPANAAYQLSSAVPPASASAATAADNCGTPTVTVAESSNGGAGSPASPLVLTRTFTATDAAGNTASAGQTIIVIDSTAPTIDGAATTSPNANGWYPAPATIHFTCADNSGVVVCPADVTLSSDGAAQSVTGTATDGSGNTATATVGPINIDQQAPTIAFGGSLTYTVDQNVAITCTITETLSGLDPAIAQTCQTASGPAYSFATGPHTLSASATDRAGNNGVASMTFTVRVTTASLCRLISRMTTMQGVSLSLCVLAAAAELTESSGLDWLHDRLMDAYVRVINRERGTSITPENADVLIRLGGEL